MKRTLSWSLIRALALIPLCLVPAALAQTWNNPSGGNWNTPSNWTGNSVPNGAGANATLGSIITSNRNVTVNTNVVTLGTLTINDNNNYTLLGGGGGSSTRTLTFDASGAGPATINVGGSGSPTISSTRLGIVLNDDTVINQSGTGVFSVNPDISGAGGLTYIGSNTSGTSGYTVLSGSNSMSGNVTVKSGLLYLDSSDVNQGAPNGLVVGDGTGAANSAIARNLQEGQVGNTATLTVYSDGWFDINAANTLVDQGGDPNYREETVGQINLYGGRITTGNPGSLNIDASLPTAGISSFANSQTALIDATGGLVDFKGLTREISVGNGTQTTDLEIRGRIANGGVIKTGDGRLSMTGTEANTYTGATTVNGGTLELAKSNSVTSIAGSAITVNSGGTLLLSSSEQINNAANMAVDGGTIAISDVAGIETLGTLTLSGNSTINLGTAVYLLKFANSSAMSWSGSLTINGWSDTPNTSGTANRIYFGNNASGLTSGQLSQISFNGFAGGAMLLTSGELVPMAVPEAGTVVAAILLVLLVLHREIGQFASVGVRRAFPRRTV